MWEHKGLKIELRGAQFAVFIDGKTKKAASLGAAKKAIDKHLEASVTAEVINLPVVVGMHRYKENPEITTHVITGIDPDDLNLIGLPESRDYVLPDSEANAKLLVEYYQLTEALEAVQARLNNREVRYFVHTRGRYKTPYPTALEILRKFYRKAVEAATPAEGDAQ